MVKMIRLTVLMHIVNGITGNKGLNRKIPKLKDL